jgi:hypothetical protein
MGAVFLVTGLQGRAARMSHAAPPKAAAKHAA